ncbi:MAG TPA: SPOR domain-containing protein [Rhodanobacter sp.]
MKTRLLGAAVLIALAVLFVPMFFSSTPPAPGGDGTVNLAIPPAPDRDLQTRTMSLAPNAAVSASIGAVSAQPLTPASSDRLATVNIGSSRPRDVEIDPEAGLPPQPTTIVTGSGSTRSEPVIPQQSSSPETRKPVAAAAPAPAKPAPAAVPTVTTPPAPAPAAARGSFTINLSAYANPTGAASLQRRVRALGYPVEGRAITQAGKSMTLVIAGPFETRAAAESARLKITQSIPGVPARLEQDAERASAAAPASGNTSTAKAGGWAVQLAAVSSQADANALRDKLRANGFDGFTDSVQSGGKQLWRVRAGPQTQRSDAQRVHDEIKAKLGIDGNVVTVP